MAKRNNNRLLLILIPVVLILIGAVVYKSRSQPRGEKVAVEKVSKRTIREMVSASGKIFPETEVKISSDVSGEIVELFVEEGDSVQAGQVLARIDPDAIQSQVERGQASVNNAKAQLANARAGIESSKAQVLQSRAQMEQIEAQLINARAIHERNIPLHQQGVISDVDFDNSLSNLNALEANVRSAEAALKTAQANLESTKQSSLAAEYTVKSSQATLKELNTSLRQTTIYAPIDGIISRLDVEQGERVVGTIQMAGTEMMRIANLNVMEVQVDVSENDVLRVGVGDQTEIEVDAYLDRKFTGIVTEIANSASGVNSGALTTDQVINFTVKIRIDPDSYQGLIDQYKRFPFRPGMSASVEINTHTEKDVLSIPIQSVTTREEEEEEDQQAQDDDIKEVVFIAYGDTTDMVEIKTGIQDDNHIQVLSGLEEGAEVISGPYSAISKKLEQGAKIQVVEEDELYKKKDSK
ncbi:MAG: efflux RND transporter periplasmic adaptor subunit [Bacteroidota bacterium]